MRRKIHPVVALMAVLSMAGCAQEEAENTVEMAAAAANVTMLMPVSTESSEALDQFMQGQRAADMGRADDARPYFQKAVELDPDFAFGYLNAAGAANSVAEFEKNLKMAVEHAAGASEAERLFIEIVERGNNNDTQGQLQAAQQLVEVAPASPRAWLALANVQSAMGNEEEARATMMKATEIAPDFVPAHMALGNSYVFTEPRDLAKAQEHMEKAVELEPNEAVPHDLLGDCYRAQNMLQQAAEEYTRTAELDPTSGNGFQQRGHVHSFLGNYDQARADYDAAIQLEKGTNNEAAFAVYRALVNVHEGNPKAAIDELEGLAGGIDAMGIPEPTGFKIFALNNAAQIALHHKMIPEAEHALQQHADLLMQQAQQIGTPAADRDARSTVALFGGYLAANKGDYETATAKAQEFMTIVEPNTNPRKNEPAQALLGYVSLLQGDFDGAITHYEQSNPNNIYTTYYHAMALEGAGRAEEAKTLYQRVATENFNSAGLALVKKDAMAKAEMASM
ncbi:MAG: tetratricopeptide repeat protein [Gemmatimonadota bacterium]|nr:MAG: tetratricopeptide repeat protein [Gemmatimonadota bacterium]